ncbi:hypothetical protein M3F36_019135 [Clostridioides difficile]|uniref:hypothetical protein n=1 Tax=Clostridioides difficile TaxID=1496 RepID=UPI001C185152|nr:hypothetical protein [Clostridioides difficile]MBY2092334.1 hypothetical protein [Clostridioides difficile]MCL6802472.1 hypothetical protein [Clostridioides difficile]HBE8153550.1 hypothetical protein [Clostridioides difficile]HBF0317556.1 hypothetical protein [Clostridioides difficile]
MDKDNIEELLNITNTRLSGKESVTKIEKDLGFGKDTLRGKLNRNGYFLDKSIKQFVKKEDIKKDNTMTTKKITQKNNIAVKNKQTQQFTEEEVIILKEIINNYKNKKETTTEFTGEVTTRSFRSYKNIMDMFSKHCKKNKLNQRDAVATALIDFINKK